MPGSNFSGQFSANVDIHLVDKNGLAMLVTITGTLPTDANVYQKACLLQKTDALTGVSGLYHNTGTSAVPIWTLL